MYEDIISLPHPEPKTHRRMSRIDRAAQFASFQALSGFAGEVDETARLTDFRTEPEEFAREELDRSLRLMLSREAERPAVRITYFVPDERKAGGAFVTADGNFRRIDEASRLVILTDGTALPIDDITECVLLPADGGEK